MKQNTDVDRGANLKGEGYRGCQAEQSWQRAMAFNPTLLIVGTWIKLSSTEGSTGLLKAEPCAPKIYLYPTSPTCEHQLIWK